MKPPRPTPKDYWRTPPAVLRAVEREFGVTIGFDMAARDAEVAVADHYVSEADDLLTMQLVEFERLVEQSPPRSAVWCNPPYSRHLIGRFVARWLYLTAELPRYAFLLTREDSSTRWAQELLRECCVRCTFSRRIRFICPETGQPRIANTGGNTLWVRRPEPRRRWRPQRPDAEQYTIISRRIDLSREHQQEELHG